MLRSFRNPSGSKAVAFPLAVVVVYIKERISIALTGIVLHTDYFIIAEKSQAICTWLLYQEKHPLGTKNVKLWEEGSDMGGNCAWARTVQTFIISFQTSSSCGKSSLSSSQDTFHCLLNDTLFSFPDFFIIFLLFFFNKAGSSALELSIGSHQYSCFLFQSWWFLHKKTHLLMETGTVSVLWTFLFPLHKWRQMLWWKYFSYLG